MDSLAAAPMGGATLRSDVSLLHVATVPAPIRNFLIPYAAHFRALGWRVDAAARGAISVSPVLDAFDNVYDLPFSRSVRNLGSLVESERAIRQLIGATSPDIVHVHTPVAAFVTRLAIRRMPARTRPVVVYTAHGFHFHRGGNWVTNVAYLSAESVAGRWTDRLVVINDEDESAAIRFRLVRPRRLLRMPGVGIDTEAYSRAAVNLDELSAIRARIGIDDQTPLFCSIAELHPNKRLGRVIEALSRMQNDNAHLAIAGDGKMRRRLESFASRQGVSRRVHFLGFLSDVRPLLAASTGFVLASEREGLARSIMEAQSLEVPVVASDARGNAELLGSDSGFIVPRGDPKGLAAAMDRLVVDPGLARTFGRRGRSRMARLYSQERVIEMHERMYASLLTERSAGGWVRRGVGPP